MSNHSKQVLKPIVIAVALALPGAAAYAESFDQVVRTKSDQNIYEQFGRDSVYAFSRDAKPLTPAETTGSRDANFFTKAKDYAANTWHKTTGFIGDRFHGDGNDAANTVTNEPMSYGRAGGYVAADRVEVLQSDAPYRANATPTDDGRASKAPLNTSYNSSSSYNSASSDVSNSATDIQSASSDVIYNPNWTDTAPSNDSTAVIAPATVDESAQLESSEPMQSSSNDEQPMMSDDTQPVIANDSDSDQSVVSNEDDDDSLAMNEDDEDEAFLYTDPSDGSTHLLIIE